MERLLADAEKLSGVEYDISNLSDVYEAIHVIQTEMGITGTTAKEAASTFSGSFASMKAAATNVLANLSLGQDIRPSLEALGETVFTFIGGNLLPMVGNLMSGLPEVISQSISMAIQGLNITAENADEILEQGLDLAIELGRAIVLGVPHLIDAGLNLAMAMGQAILDHDWAGTLDFILTGVKDELAGKSMEFFATDGSIIEAVALGVEENCPNLLESGIEVVSSVAGGILENLPAATDATGEVLTNVLQLVLDAAPSALENGFELIGNLATGLLDNAPAVMESIGSIVGDLLGFLMDSMPDLFEKGIDFVGQMAYGLLENTPEVLSAAASVVLDLVGELLSHAPNLLESGLSLIGEMAAGLILAIPDVASAAGDIIGDIIAQFGETDWLQVGLDIINGIIAGLWSGIQAIIDAAWDVAQAALDAAKDALDINSPSGAFRDEVGKHVPSGIAVGIEENTDVIDDVMDELADFMLETFHVDFRSAVELGDVSVQKNLKLESDYTPSRVSGTGSRTFNVTIHVHAAQGMDEDAIAKKVAWELGHEIEVAEAGVA